MAAVSVKSHTRNGKKVRAHSRGDGGIGKDITKIAREKEQIKKKIKTVQAKLKALDTRRDKVLAEFKVSSSAAKALAKAEKRLKAARKKRLDSAAKTNSSSKRKTKRERLAEVRRQIEARKAAERRNS